jgi:hypothetical protein
LNKDLADQQKVEQHVLLMVVFLPPATGRIGAIIPAPLLRFGFGGTCSNQIRSLKQNFPAKAWLGLA